MSKSRERFVRLAENRVTRAIRDLRLIGNLANRSNYSYERKDAEKIVSALEKELKLLRRRFDTDENANEVVFKL